ncbi:MAG: Ldh family oxidoreductase [Thermomicrobiales bacterium]
MSAEPGVATEEQPSVPTVTIGTVPRFTHERVVAFVAEAFTAAGMDATDAREAAEFLTLADLRGVESHGVARLPGYISRLKAGLIDPHAELTVVQEWPSTLALDARNGLGLTMGRQAMVRTMAKAEESGICLTTVRNSNHFGIAGSYALMAAERGLGGMAMTNASRLVVPTFSRAAMLGTNPIAFAVPTGSGRPFILDMSTSTVAWGKIEIARRAGMPIPEGWALDREGHPTTDPTAVGGLMPLGGPREQSGHKGYGLALMVEVLTAMLAGSAWSYDIGRTTSTAGYSSPGGIGHCFLAWRIDAFRDPAEFAASMDAMIAELRAAPLAEGVHVEGVLIPGDPEAESEAVNRAQGTPVRAEVLAELTEMAATVGILPLDHPGRAALVG